jgi:cytochrome c oxidase assembly protein subunit 15
MIERSSAPLWLARAGIAGCILMAAIIVSSAYLRLTTMGIGCEPWPACYGRIQAPVAATDARARDDIATSVKIARLLHRAAAMLVAILAVLTMLLSLVPAARSGRNVAAAACILTLTVMLAAVGRMSATLLVPAVGVANLLGGFGLLACFWALRLNNRDRTAGIAAAEKRVRRVAGLFLLLFVFQAAAGALISVTYSAALCPSLWICDAGGGPTHDSRAFNPFAAQPIDVNGKVVAAPATAIMQTAHRVSGIASAALFAAFGVWLVRLRAQRTRGATVLGLASAEAAIGVLMATHDFPLPAAMAHNAAAALLLLVLVSLVWPRAPAHGGARSD